MNRGERIDDRAVRPVEVVAVVQDPGSNGE